MQHTEELLAFRGRQLRSSDGEKVGTIEEIYLDTQTNAPEWALVNTGLFGTKRSFVPLRAARRGDDGVEVPFDKQRIKDAPQVDPDGDLSPREEAALYRHYGIDHDDEQPVGRDVSGPTTDEAMTRSEEELRVGTADRETGRVRLRKYVVEDEVTQRVPVRREEVRLEREPIDETNVDAAMSGPAISDEEHEVVLHAEEPVVEKRAVPKERVRLDKDEHTEVREVSDTVRREEIDLQQDTEQR